MAIATIREVIAGRVLTCCRAVFGPILRRLVTGVITGCCTGNLHMGHSQVVQRRIEQSLFVLLEVAFRLRFHHSQ